MIPFSLRSLGAVALTAFSGCGAEESVPHPVSEPSSSGLLFRPHASLDVFAAGEVVHVLCATAEDEGTPSELLHVRSSDGGRSWSTPVRVDQGAPPAHRPNATNAPQVAARGDELLAVWSTKGKGTWPSSLNGHDGFW